MENRYIISTPNGYNANKVWRVEDTANNSVVFTCEHEGDALQEATRLNHN